jgi:hypothetical protein
MGSSTRVVERMDQRADELCDRFPACLALFSASAPFAGPSLYFHRKTIELRERHSSIHTLVDDEAYFDAAYATLAAWGMHRMGPGKTKLLDIATIRDSVRENATALEQLAALHIATVAVDQYEDVIGQLWALIARLRVSVAEARIVANSKMLHHILPELVPPIDREYTFRLFYGRTMLSIDEERGFREMFLRLLRIGHRSRATIEATPRSGWNTSSAKVVDNAIVGYILSRRAAAQ